MYNIKKGNLFKTMDTKLITHDFSTGSMYACGVQWAFVGKVEKDYELLHGPLTCKDYTHEVICNTVHNERLYTNGVSKILPLDLEKLQVVIIVPIVKAAGKNITKEVVYSAKKIFSSLEIAGGLAKTLIKEVTPDDNPNNNSFFILTMKKHMVESPVLLHSLLALIRTTVEIGTILDKDNIDTTFKNGARKDSEILYKLFSSGTLQLLLKEHKTIFAGGVDLTVIYPKKSESGTSYHSGFGPVALKRNELCSAWYRNTLKELLSTNNIEFS